MSYFSGSMLYSISLIPLGYLQYKMHKESLTENMRKIKDQII